MKGILKIGIDVDNTLFYCNSLLYKIIAKFKFSSIKHKLKYTEVPICKETRVGSFYKNVFKFFDPKAYKPCGEAVETINLLHHIGNKIVLITSRPAFGPFVSSLQEWLSIHNVCCDTLVMGCNNKTQYISNNNIDLLIDDLPKNCRDAEKLGQKSILYTGVTKLNDKKLKRGKNLCNIASTWKGVWSMIQGVVSDSGTFATGTEKSE